MQETQVQSLGQEDPLEEEVATCSSVLAWRIPWTEKPGGLQSLVSQRVGHDWVIKCVFSVHFISLLLTQIYRFLFSSPSKAQHKMKDSSNLFGFPVGVTSSLLFWKLSEVRPFLFSQSLSTLSRNSQSFFIKYSQDGWVFPSFHLMQW